MIREVLEVAELVKAAGGRALLVGGSVRDKLLGIEPKDFDFECYGLDASTLQCVLEKRFVLDLVGASFGVMKLHGAPIDVALPRRETKLGEGHRAFEMVYDPTMTIKEASARRDFTINAIYLDPLTDEIVDPWNGRADLEKRILRHVSDRFGEDPLRVLRGMQFVARFDLESAPETIEVCRKMTPENLAVERLEEEWGKLLVKGVKISKGLEFLRATGWIKYYPELEKLVGCEQDPEWHPEGDVWEHVKDCLDKFAAARIGDADEDLVVGLAVLCHDFGKPACTAFDPRKGRIRSLGHDEAGVAPTEEFLKRLTNETRILKEVPPLVRYHMRPFAMWRDRSSDGAIRRLAARVGRIDRLVRVAAADGSTAESCEWLMAQAERLRIADAAPKPLVGGRDLIALGMKPSVRFGKLLKAAYDAQLDGAFLSREGGVEYLKRAIETRKRYILWDWNGTLLDDTKAALDTLNAMLAKRGNPAISMEFYRDHFAFPVKPFYRSIGVCLENEDWDKLAVEYHDVYAAQPKALNRDTFAALEKVKAAGVKQSIISALRQDLLDEITERFGVKAYMECVYGVNNLNGESKIDRALELLEKIADADPVIIGDSLHDKEVADAIGVKCVLCSQGSHAHHRLAAVAPTGKTLVEAVEFALEL